MSPARGFDRGNDPQPPMNRHRMDAITPEAAVTLASLFRERVRRSPSAVAYRHCDAGSRQWTDTPWQRMAAEVTRWQRGHSPARAWSPATVSP